ncbi:MAG: flagellar basal body P-ring formation protein FlgA [Verrucomicrobia bacterium]|nr:flagellar basal body P-ring formation protein FlgA [Verrucomicrobiota bacterium]
MKTQQPITVIAASSRLGRALLHLVCVCRGGDRRWHGRGIIRELFSRRVRANSRATGGSWRRTTASFVVGLQTALGVIAAPAVIDLELRNNAQVDSSGVYLHHLVSSTPASLSPQPIRLADAPSFGRALSFSPEQLNELLRRAMPQLTSPSWTGASQVRVIRRSRFLGEGELRELLIATLQSEQVRDKGTLELNLGRPWPGVNLPDESLTLRVLNMPASGVSPNFIVRFELVAGTERFGPWQTVVQARIMKDVPVARLLVKRGQPLQAADFTAERRDVLSLREPVPVETLSDPTLEIIENVMPGQPLLARSIRMRPVVLRGQVVDGLVRDGSMNISLKVEVLADGLPGQTVRVRNPKNKREFYAKVQDEQTVVINL